MIYVIKRFYWLTYFTIEFETAGEIFEISGPKWTLVTYLDSAFNIEHI